MTDCATHMPRNWVFEECSLALSVGIEVMLSGIFSRARNCPQMLLFAFKQADIQRQAIIGTSWEARCANRSSGFLSRSTLSFLVCWPVVLMGVVSWLQDGCPGSGLYVMFEGADSESLTLLIQGKQQDSQRPSNFCLCLAGLDHLP